MSRIRFRSASWLQQDPISVMIAGTGGYGAYLTYLISQNLPADSTLTLYDPDRVEIHNVGNQFFSLVDVGAFKVTACVNRLEEFTADEHIVIQAKTEPAVIADVNPDIVLIATDNMASRTELYEKWKSQYVDGNIFIDMRSAAQQFQMFVLTQPSSRYEQTFFGDAEVSEGDCAFRQTPQTSMMSAALCTQAVCNLLIGLPVPYLTKWYGAGLLLMKTE